MSPISGRPAAFFDLDKTIIAKSSTLAFSREFQAGGLISRGAVLRSAYAQFVYLVSITRSPSCRYEPVQKDQSNNVHEKLNDKYAG